MPGPDADSQPERQDEVAAGAQSLSGVLAQLERTSAQLQHALSRIAELEAEVGSNQPTQASQPRVLGQGGALSMGVSEPLRPALVNTEVHSTPLQQTSQPPLVARAPTSGMLSAPPLLQPLTHNYPAAGVSAPPSFPSGRDEIPVFYGEAPASLGLQRNQEIKSWIASIELLTRPATDDAFIRMAWGRSRGYAQMVLLGPLFEGVTQWHEFKARLRAKFRGASTSQHFFEMLAQARMVPG